MKKLYFLFFLTIGFLSNAQTINFPDPELNLRLLSASPTNTIAKDLSGNYFKIDADNNGAIEINEALNVSYLDINSYSTFDQDGLPVNLNPISDLTGLNTFNNLQNLICSGNYIGNGSLDVRLLTNLKALTAKHCGLNNLYIDGMTNLESVEFFANSVASINLNGLSNLKKFYCHGNNFSTIDVTSLTNLEELDCYANNMTSLNVTGLSNLKRLNCSNNELSILNLTGLNNLEILNIGNNLFSSINFSNCPLLKSFDCRNNNFTNLDFSGLSILENLYFNYNSISTVNLSPLNNLKTLECSNNLLMAINLSGLNMLNYLICDDNNLTQLDISGLNLLTYISCKNNNISNFNLDASNQFYSLHINNNNLQNLDLSLNTILISLNANDNLLTNLNIKNGKIEGNLSFSGNPNLNYICADDDQLTNIDGKIIQYGYSNCHVNSYCFFTPGGAFYEITGNTKFDFNSNGCDVSDINYSNLKFNTTDGTNIGSFIANQTGNYNFSVQEGNHTITPNLENPSYFNISPTSFNVDFPTQASPFNQDFCVTANGVKSDVEVMVMPTTPARPGFDGDYKLVYRNKGNQIENGSVSVTFDDTSLDYVSSNPVYDSAATNSFTWNYTNLQPFETREVEITFNVNSPMEIPAVNNGDILNYTATITTSNTDETPTDNTFTLDQTVVGSYDPNDKTCLQGTTITQSEVGKYVQYVIRFENTGTFPAENIVVKDMIDLTKFDIATLVPLKSSHDFYTRIKDNKVEFIFENINLDFNDATNDGYVAFKIKTLPTLVLGNTFTNNANIYFDYNFPITTNTYTTTVAALSAQDFDFGNYFSVYPNPAKDVLNIQTKQDLSVNSVEIYNQLGQIVLAVTNAVNTVDVANLASGTYFVKVNTEKGSANMKFVKE